MDDIARTHNNQLWYRMSASLSSSWFVSHVIFLQKIINILCNGIRQPPFDKDTHNNQPKTGGDNGG